MTAVTNDLVFELLKRIHGDIGELKFDLHELKKRMTGTGEGPVGINGRLDRHDERLDRIEKRLEPRELTEAQARSERDE